MAGVCRLDWGQGKVAAPWELGPELSHLPGPAREQGIWVTSPSLFPLSHLCPVAEVSWPGSEFLVMQVCQGVGLRASGQPWQSVCGWVVPKAKWGPSLSEWEAGSHGARLCLDVRRFWSTLKAHAQNAVNEISTNSSQSTARISEVGVRPEQRVFWGNTFLKCYLGGKWLKPHSQARGRLCHPSP